MNTPSSSQGGETEPLLSLEEVRAIFTESNPDYGKDFTDQQWEEIAERLSALTRLIVRFSNRKREK